MQCASCGFDNREGTRFCVECGTPLATRCPACRAEAQPGQKFCGECGTALTGAPATAPAEPSAVRKTVTVLFADLGGSTGFGERTDAERLKREAEREESVTLPLESLLLRNPGEGWARARDTKDFRVHWQLEGESLARAPRATQPTTRSSRTSAARTTSRSAASTSAT